MHLLHQDLARARIAELRAEAARATRRPRAETRRRALRAGTTSHGQRWTLAILRWLPAANAGPGDRDGTRGRCAR